MNVIRKTIPAGKVTEFTFDKDGIQFVVKNLTDDRIYACLGNTYIEEQSVVVLPVTSDNLYINEEEENGVRTVQVYSEKGGEVEIQCVSYAAFSTDINEILNIIENGVYGKDIRQAIHDGIKQVYSTTVSLDARLTNIEKNS